MGLPSVTSSAGSGSEYVDLEIDRRIKKPRSSKSGRLRDKPTDSNPANLSGPRPAGSTSDSGSIELGAEGRGGSSVVHGSSNASSKSAGNSTRIQPIALWIMLAVAAGVIAVTLAIAILM
jgi:hypothetical protein